MLKAIQELKFMKLMETRLLLNLLLLINQYNKIYLTNLNQSQDAFDLKIINGSIEIDHIIDPAYTEQYYFIGEVLQKRRH